MVAILNLENQQHLRPAISCSGLIFPSIYDEFVKPIGTGV
jgi:hypothetical protein